MSIDSGTGGGGEVGLPLQNARILLERVFQTERSASEDEINRAYKKLALIHHPDRNPGATRDQIFIHVT